MLQVRESEISLRKWSGGTAHFCAVAQPTSEGSLITNIHRECWTPTVAYAFTTPLHSLYELNRQSQQKRYLINSPQNDDC